MILLREIDESETLTKTRRDRLDKRSHHTRWILPALALTLFVTHGLMTPAVAEALCPGEEAILFSFDVDPNVDGPFDSREIGLAAEPLSGEAISVSFNGQPFLYFTPLRCLVNPPQFNEEAPISLKFIDMNAPGFDIGNPATYVYTSLPWVRTRVSTDAVFEGDANNTFLGSSLAAGDVDGRHGDKRRRHAQRDDHGAAGRRTLPLAGARAARALQRGRAGHQLSRRIPPTAPGVVPPPRFTRPISAPCPSRTC